MYKRASYLAARAADQRELQARRRSFNIFTDHAFKQSNVFLDGVLKKNKKDGMERPVVHKEVITEFDEERLGSYFADVLTTND